MRAPERTFCGLAFVRYRIEIAATTTATEKSFMAKTDEAKAVQEFFYSAPEANSVQLVGDFTHWQRASPSTW
jgi:1,4-alpha-glucan branching enzyme